MKVVDVADAPIVATVTTGTMAFDPATGMHMTTRTILTTDMITISGSYPSDAVHDSELNEIFRQAYRGAPLSDHWSITAGNTLNPSSIGITSDAVGNHFSEVTTAPAMIGTIGFSSLLSVYYYSRRCTYYSSS